MVATAQQLFVCALLACLITATRSTATPVFTPSPIGGILTVPDLPVSGCVTRRRRLAPTPNTTASFAPSFSCFADVYVKWLEQAGVRVAVIPFDASPAEQRQIAALEEMLAEERLMTASTRIRALADNRVRQLDARDPLFRF